MTKGKRKRGSVISITDSDDGVKNIDLRPSKRVRGRPNPVSTESLAALAAVRHAAGDTAIALDDLQQAIASFLSAAK